MATIRTSIELMDRITNPLQNITSALHMTVSAFEDMNTAANSSFETANYEGIRNHLNAANTELDEMVNNIDDNGAAQEEFNETIQRGTNHADGLQRKILGMVGAYASLRGLGNLLDLSDTMAQTEARLSLIVDDGGSVDELEKKIFESAQNSRASYSSTADMVAKLGMQASQAFSSNDELIAFSEQINKTFVIAGTEVQGVNSVMLQLTQAMASGALRGEELNAVLDNATPIVANIQKYLEEVMNIDSSNIKQLAADGILTAEVIKNAMLYTTDATNAMFNEIPVTFKAVSDRIKNIALVAFDPLLERLSAIASSERFDTMVSGITSSFVYFSTVAVEALDAITWAGVFMADNWSLISPIIYGVITALGLYLAHMVLNNTLTAISTGIQTAHAIAIAVKTRATIADVAATEGLTVAQWALNSAMLASPITWIILGVIAAVYIGVALMNKFAHTSISATGIVAGVFFALGAYIFNLLAHMWNNFAAVAEFFVNVWKHPVYSTKALFANLTMNILDMAISMSSSFDSVATNIANAFVAGANMAISAINWIIEAINKIPGVDISTVGKMGQVESFTGGLQNMKANVSDWLGDAPDDYWKAPTMGLKDIGAAYNSGYEWGSGMEDKLSDIIGGKLLIPDPSDTFTPDDYASGGGGLGDKVGKIADDTGAMRDSLDLTSENLKYLRDVAERDVINRFTTAEVKVEQINHNNINNEIDLDGVIDHLATGLEEALEKVAEGVHE